MLRALKTFALMLAFSLCPAAFAQTAPETAAPEKDYNVSVSTTSEWTDAKIDLASGNYLEITASGKTCNAEGVPGASVKGTVPVADALPGALIAKLSKDGPAVAVGSSKEIPVTTTGHLYLGVNATGDWPCKGTIDAKIHFYPQMSEGALYKKKLAAAAQVWMQGQFGKSSSGEQPKSGTDAQPGSGVTTDADLKISNETLDAGFRKNLDGLPRRVNDQFNNLGDMVNFVIVGNEDQVKSALEVANWHIADTNNKGAVLNALVETYEKKDYLQMPMSTLYLFGRKQDYGYEEAEPIAMVASRNHFRIWKTGFTFDGKQVWVGAGTHDIGFEKDQRNGSVTHKIDPAVDGERSNIGLTLQNTGHTKSISYYLPPNPVQETHNATGGSYHSDGRLLVVFLK